MKLGVCLSHSKALNLKSFTDIKEMGFSRCQLISWSPALWTDEEAAKINGFVKDSGVTISAFWCGYSGRTEWNFYEGQETLGLVSPTYRYVRTMDLINGADFAKKLNVKDVVSHMGFIPENPYDQNYLPLIMALKTVSLHLKENNQYLLFETGQETPVTMLRAFTDIGTDNLGVNLDPANLIMYGKANPVDALDVFGKYVMNLHAKDGKYPTNGKDLGPEVAIGSGKVDFKALLKGLKELGYDGDITIEREIEGEQQAHDIKAAKEYLENILKSI